MQCRNGFKPTLCRQKGPLFLLGNQAFDTPSSLVNSKEWSHSMTKYIFFFKQEKVNVIEALPCLHTYEHHVVTHSCSSAKAD